MMDSFCRHRCALPNQGLCSQSLPKLQISNLRCCKTWHLNSLEHSFLRAFWGLKQICRSQDFRQSWWGHQLPLLQSDLFPATIQEIASDCSPLGANQAACSVMAQRGFDTWQSLHGVWWILKDKGCFLWNPIHFLDIQWNNMKYMQQEVTRSDYKSNIKSSVPFWRLFKLFQVHFVHFVHFVTFFHILSAFSPSLPSLWRWPLLLFRLYGRCCSMGDFWQHPGVSMCLENIAVLLGFNWALCEVSADLAFAWIGCI